MENPLDGPWPSAAVSGRCVGRTDTVELRCLGQRKCFGPTLERDPQRRLGNSARWPEQLTCINGAGDRCTLTLDIFSW